MGSAILEDTRTIALLDELTVGFSSDDIALLKQILKENIGNEYGILESLMGYTYSETPVGLRRFVEDPYYLGLEGQVFPKIMDDLEELFEGGYVEAILTGAIGWGKSTFAEIAMTRMLYEISCFKNPQAVFGLMKGSVIALLNIAVTKDNAKKVVFQGIKNKLHNSPYFMEKFPYGPWQNELRFPNNIWVFPAAAGESGVIGYNVFGGVMDEVNFMSLVEKSSRSAGQKYDQADIMQKSLIRRMKSRFMKKGKLPGILLQISSSRYPEDFTERRITEAADDPSVFVRRYSQWDTFPPERWSGERFLISLGNGAVAPEILKTEEDMKRAEEQDLPTMEVPIEFYRDFEGDIDASIRDFAGRPTLTIHPFIRYRGKVTEALLRGEAELGLKHPFSLTETTLQDGGTFLMDHLSIPRLRKQIEQTTDPAEKKALQDELKFLRNRPRFVHGDLSYAGDATGIAMGYVRGYKDVIRRNEEGEEYTMKQPIIVIEFMLRIKPPKGGEIQLADIRSLIYELRSYGYPIRKATFDQFQSKDSMQQLERSGIQSGHLSADTNPEVYNAYRDAMYEDRLITYMYEPLLNETIRLEKNVKKNKVDHPANGSKDVADAVAGVCYHCVVSGVTAPPPPPSRGTLTGGRSSGEGSQDRITKPLEILT